MGIGNGCDQAICTLNRHIAIGGQIIGTVDMIRVHPHAQRGGHQFIALGVAANGGQQGRGQAKAAQGHRDVRATAPAGG